MLAHCGGDPAAALHHLAGAVAAAPEDPGPYALLAELWRDRTPELTGAVEGSTSLRAVLALSYVSFLDGDMDRAALAIGSVTGARPDVAWARAPWFGDERFLGAVSADALAEAALRTMDRGHDLDSDAMRERLRPWFEAIEAVSARQPSPEALARMAMMLRACGLTDASFALCDRADAVQRTMMVEVVRAGTWRRVGDARQAAAAFERALALDPGNWSLHLDLADLHAEQGDFAAAARWAGEGLTHEPAEITLRAAAAAYRARLSGSAADLRQLVELAPDMPNPAYLDLLLDHACAGPGLPPELISEAGRARRG
ncbi:hypothetical protein WN71_009535 [Streptomyces mangrovisoli]|uniref:Uncharacterized protein n=1 Tax=Streptomyces mangrovisoli TaxID=1428628 RepID=A0A1J4P076_9ACTN|nr:hypothetical protein WN71_009535 [Streptomyces mangrovisoli]